MMYGVNIWHDIFHKHFVKLALVLKKIQKTTRIRRKSCLKQFSISESLFLPLKTCISNIYKFTSFSQFSANNFSNLHDKNHKVKKILQETVKSLRTNLTSSLLCLQSCNDVQAFFNVRYFCLLFYHKQMALRFPSARSRFCKCQIKRNFSLKNVVIDS